MRAIWTRLAPGIATLALALASGAANAECDFLTGGGFIIVASGAKANFGVAGGCKNGMPTWGHLEYMDHGIGLNVHWTSITAYQFDSSGGFDSHGQPLGSRFICGKARTNLPPPYDNDVDFAVRAKDAGEPGDMDEFDIQLKKGTVFYTTNLNFAGLPHQLSGGNIQLHTPNPSTTGSFSTDSCPARSGSIA